MGLVGGPMQALFAAHRVCVRVCVSVAGNVLSGVAQACVCPCWHHKHMQADCIGSAGRVDTSMHTLCRRKAGQTVSSMTADCCAGCGFWGPAMWG